MRQSPVILLIEDNSNSARMMLRLLEQKNYFVIHAANGESGIQLAIQEKPDLILLDLGLPDLDGQTVAACIRRLEGLEAVTLVIVSAWPYEHARQMVAAYDFQGYIAQPIDTREFAQQVAGFLSISGW